jgi:hypothetical protein
MLLPRLNRQPPEKQAFRGVCPHDFTKGHIPMEAMFPMRHETQNVIIPLYEKD